MTSPSKITIFWLILAVVLMVPGATAVEVNSTIIDPGDQAYVQFEFWVLLFSASILFLILSFILPRCADMCAVLATLFASITAYTTMSIEFYDVSVVNETVVLSHYVAHHPWLAWTMLGVWIVCLINTFRVAFDLYWNKNLRGG